MGLSPVPSYLALKIYLQSISSVQVIVILAMPIILANSYQILNLEEGQMTYCLAVKTNFSHKLTILFTERMVMDMVNNSIPPTNVIQRVFKGVAIHIE